LQGITSDAGQGVVAASADEMAKKGRNERQATAGNDRRTIPADEQVRDNRGFMEPNFPNGSRHALGIGHPMGEHGMALLHPQAGAAKGGTLAATEHAD
jgi:hypothetical protein